MSAWTPHRRETAHVHAALPKRISEQRRCALRLAACATLSAALCCAVFGQGQVMSGNSLDANLQVGSFGYNGRTPGSAPLRARNYAPYAGVSRQIAPSGGWVTAASSRNQGISNQDVFLTQRAYSPVWQDTASASSRGGDGTGAASTGGWGNGSPSAGAVRLDYRLP